jgi:SSS family solute:Na+ symporter
MAGLDYFILIAYIAGVFAMGGLFGGRIKTSKDMFAAGGQSPWWVSGMSGFMTMFSAGTFVVWGGIAYRLGAVAISISLCYGVAALLTGWFVAGRWKRIGVTTAAEFIQLRFGRTALQFYTWTGMLYKLVGVGVALYSVSVLLCALVPLPEGFPLRDPSTGRLDLTWGILLFGGIVVIYTAVGGLWAVLMTDVLQFIVLTVAVTMLVPLLFDHPAIGGVGGFIEQAPPGFFSPTAGEFTWLFLGGWVAIHFFMIGGEWAFVQRFICVPSERDARKSAWLFGVLYLVSPVVWMLPPMLYRVIDPSANPQEAYILACKEALPAGLLGLMLAAMFSATASMVDSQLNVFSGVLTRDFYLKRFRSRTSEVGLVRVGRVITVILGIALIGLALGVPHFGGAERVTLSVASLIVGPLLAPTVWGLLSSRINTRAVWWTAGISFASGLIVKFGLIEGSVLTTVLPLTTGWVQSNTRLVELLIGVLLPVMILAVHHWRGGSLSAGWAAVEEHRTLHAVELVVASGLPGRLVAVSFGVLGILLLTIAALQPRVSVVLWVYGIFLLLAALVLVLWRRRGTAGSD